MEIGPIKNQFFVVPPQFSQDNIGEWPENQILIPDFHKTLAIGQKIKF